MQHEQIQNGEHSSPVSSATKRSTYETGPGECPSVSRLDTMSAHGWTASKKIQIVNKNAHGLTAQIYHHDLRCAKRGLDEDDRHFVEMKDLRGGRKRAVRDKLSFMFWIRTASSGAVLFFLSDFCDSL